MGAAELGAVGGKALNLDVPLLGACLNWFSFEPSWNWSINDYFFKFDRSRPGMFIF